MCYEVLYSVWLLHVYIYISLHVSLAILPYLCLISKLLPFLFCVQVDSRSDARDFDQLRNSMSYVGYKQEEMNTVWKLLAAILQLVSSL